MKADLKLLSFATLLSWAHARRCQNVTFPITIAADNVAFNLKPPASNIEVENFILNLTRQQYDFAGAVTIGPKPINGTYKIAATYCEPNSGPGKILQIETHGIAFDRGYWDFPADKFKYSYNKVAVDDHGFSTFAWDRLGLGQSSRGDAVNEIQSALELAALREITILLRQGKIPGIGHPYCKTIHIGHSFGSILSYTFAQENPHLTNGLVLTGFSQAMNFIPYSGLGGNFVLANTLPPFASYPAGYIASGSLSGVQAVFFAPGQFDPAILQAANDAGQPAAVGEFLTLFAGTPKSSPFPGPVLIITGERDIPFCGGNCNQSIDPAVSNMLEISRARFPNASVVETTIVPQAGHGLNLEYSASFTYSKIFAFIAKTVKLR